MEKIEKTIRFILIVLTVSFIISRTAYAGMKKVVIDTPNPCCKVSKVEGRKVYLKSGKQPCIQVIGKEVIEVDISVKSVMVYVDDAAWAEQEVKEFNIESISDYRKTVEEYSTLIKVPENIHQGQAQNKAEETAKVYQSEEFKQKVQSETERIKKEVFGEPLSRIENYYKDMKKDKDSKRAGKLASTERIYVFISSSMPLEAIRTYIKDVSTLKDGRVIFVMNGFIGGMKHIKPTIEFTAKAMLKDKDCKIMSGDCETNNVAFQVDPLLFRKYGITKAPAFVYVPHLDVFDRHKSEGLEENSKISDFYVLYGDASFDYVLEVLHRETNSQSLEKLMTALKDGFYSK